MVSLEILLDLMALGLIHPLTEINITNISR